MLVLLAIAGIIILTVMKPNTTMALSDSFKYLLVKLCEFCSFDVDSQWWNTTENIRWVGHVIEYFVLGILVGLAVRKKIAGLAICMTVSFTDQILKKYVPVRHFDKADIPFDIIGYVSGLLVAWIIIFTARKINDLNDKANQDKFDK